MSPPSSDAAAGLRAGRRLGRASRNRSQPSRGWSASRPSSGLSGVSALSAVAMVTKNLRRGSRTGRQQWAPRVSSTVSAGSKLVEGR